MVGSTDPTAFAIQVTNPTKFDGAVGSERFTLGTDSVTAVNVDRITELVIPEVIPGTEVTGSLTADSISTSAVSSNYLFTQPEIFVEIVQPLVLEATITAPGQQVQLNRYFTNDYTVDWGDGTGLETMITSQLPPHTYANDGTYRITLTSARSTVRRWTFHGASIPLVPTLGTTATDVKAVAWPQMRVFMANDNTADNAFFESFNRTGALTELAAGSFDISDIETTGTAFFAAFNASGKLTSLPDGSFNTGNITSIGGAFFSTFNGSGQLTALPLNSFGTSGITEAGINFFQAFNAGGQLSSLPPGSFDTSNIESAGNSLFNSFNSGGQLTSLPDGSFNMTALTSVGSFVFQNFNYGGRLASLPDGSFNTSNVTRATQDFFGNFNLDGQLSHLPDSFVWPSFTEETFPFQSFSYAFHSRVPLDRSAQDIIGGCATPVKRQYTFNSIQPGYSELAPNWKG
jgi:hypothetical protein